MEEDIKKMSNFIDFSKCKVDNYRQYGGANGGKKAIVYEDETYMIKTASVIKQPNRDTKYSNSCISEYVSCHIINDIGLLAQETLLGTYKGKDVVACKDFTEDGRFTLKDFMSLKNTLLDSNSNGTSVELDSIIQTFREQEAIGYDEINKHFWNMFVVDTLLGNFDRHNGNWGFLSSSSEQIYKISPIFDCGSCLYPQVVNREIEIILDSETEINNRIYIFPNSAIKINGKKINYVDFWHTNPTKDALTSLREIYPKISINRINNIIDTTPINNDLLKIFLKTMIKERYDRILTPAFELYLGQNMRKKDLVIDTMKKTRERFLSEKEKSTKSIAD